MTKHRVITPAEVRVGDTIRITGTEDGIARNATLTIAKLIRYENGRMAFWTAEGDCHVAKAGDTIRFIGRQLAPMLPTKVGATIEAKLTDGAHLAVATLTRGGAWVGVDDSGAERIITPILITCWRPVTVVADGAWHEREVRS